MGSQAEAGSACRQQLGADIRGLAPRPAHAETLAHRAWQPFNGTATQHMGSSAAQAGSNKVAGSTAQIASHSVGALLTTCSIPSLHAHRLPAAAHPLCT